MTEKSKKSPSDSKFLNIKPPTAFTIFDTQSSIKNSLELKSPTSLLLAKKIQEDILLKPALPQIVVSDNECKSRIIKPYYQFPETTFDNFEIGKKKNKELQCDESEEFESSEELTSSTSSSSPEKREDVGTPDHLQQDYLLIPKKVERSYSVPTNLMFSSPTEEIPKPKKGSTSLSPSIPTSAEMKKAAMNMSSKSASTMNVLKQNVGDEFDQVTLEQALGFTPLESIHCLQFIEGLESRLQECINTFSKTTYVNINSSIFQNKASQYCRYYEKKLLKWIANVTSKYPINAKYQSVMVAEFLEYTKNVSMNPESRLILLSALSVFLEKNIKRIRVTEIDVTRRRSMDDDIY